MDVEILPGDFFSTAGGGIIGWLNEHWTKTPHGSHTKRFHFGVISDTVLDKNGKFEDMETRESIWKGPSALRFLNRYYGQDIELYRLPDITKEEGERLALSISKIGDKGYGYKDFLQAFWDMIKLLICLKFPPYTADQLTTSASDVYICTEIPAYGANAIGKPIEPKDYRDVWVIPVVYLQAIEEGRLIMYYKGNLEDLYPNYPVTR
jgi:hypothetical protein